MLRAILRPGHDVVVLIGFRMMVLCRYCATGREREREREIYIYIYTYTYTETKNMGFRV